MPVKAIIYDLDNTIFPVSAIGDKLFAPLFDAIAQSGNHTDSLDAIKYAIMRTPYRIVAANHGFSDELTQQGIDIQEQLEFTGPIATFEDYPLIKSLPAKRFLVTTGFDKMQNSKIDNLGIRNDFEEVHVVNPVLNSKQKVFADILQRYGYTPDEVLVVGDDPESEIAAARALGIRAVLYDPENKFGMVETDFTIQHYGQFVPLVAGL